MAKNEKSQESPRIKAVVDLEEPSEELLKWAERNINENPDTKDLFISDLRDMIFEKGECTPSRTDDEFLLTFLRARHFVLKLAHRLYVKYHNFKEETPEYFNDVNLEKMIGILKTNIYNCPPKRDNIGRRILIMKIGEWVPSDYTPKELIQFVIFLIQITLLEPETQIKGGILVVDLSGLSLEMVWYLTPKLAKQIVHIAVLAIPLRLESINFVYSSWIFDTAFNMLKVFIPEPVRKRIIFHNDVDTLHSKVDSKYLPQSLGGTLEEYPLENWLRDAVLTNDKVVKEVEKLGYPLRKFLSDINYV